MSTRTHFIIYIILLAGCIDDAPRDNPLDPLSPAYTEAGSMTGVVRIANQSTAIAGVIVTDLDENVFVMTDTLGYFVFNHLSTGRHRFVCTKENYTNDTFQVEIQDRVSTHVVRGLNGAPVVLSQNILTRKIDQYFPSPQYFVEVTAEMTDPNGDIDLDSVWFSVADTILFPLTNPIGSKKFSTTIFKNQLPTNTIQWLVGKSLHIVSRDDNRSVNIGSPFFVTRVIEQTASPILSNTDSLDTSFELKWSPPDVTFNFSYTVTISILVGGVPLVVKTYTSINSFFEKITYPYQSGDAPLQQGSYLWSVTVVDEFGNYARSKESTFTVK